MQYTATADTDIGIVKGTNQDSIADCYRAICEFMTAQSVTTEHSKADYDTLFDEVNRAIEVVDRADDGEANYDKISLYYATILLINSNAEYIAAVGCDRDEVSALLDDMYDKSMGIKSILACSICLKTFSTARQTITTSCTHRI